MGKKDMKKGGQNKGSSNSSKGDRIDNNSPKQDSCK